MAELRGILLSDLWSFQLLRRRQQAVVLRESLLCDVDLLDELDRSKVVGLGGTLELVQHCLFNVWVPTWRLLIFGLETDGAGVLAELVLVEHGHGDDVVACRVDVDVDLLDQRSLLVNTLKLLRRDELPVLQLLHVLDPVNQRD